MFEISAGKVKTVSGHLSYRQSLKSALLTTINELVGDPVYGSDIKSSIFELSSPLMQQIMKEAIVETARKHTPQLRIQSININMSGNSISNNPIVINYYTIDTGETNFIELVPLPDGTITTR